MPIGDKRDGAGDFAEVARTPVSRRSPEITPTAPERYGDPAELFDVALTLLINHLSKTKFAATDHPKSVRATSTRSRYIPAAVKREVWERDEGRCAFQGERGRCTETGFLEYHHVVPYADGGATTSANLELRCRTHNVYEAEEYVAQAAESLFARERPVMYG